MEGNTEYEKFDNLAQLTHKDQAIFCLNALWEEGAEAAAEDFWKWKLLFDEYDIAKRAEGTSLDELNAHRFLESLDDTHTVKELRDKLREIGWVKRPMLFPISVYIILHFGADWKKVVRASQGDNSEGIAKAQALLEEVTAAFEEAAAAAEASKAAAAEAAASAEAARAADAEAAASAEAARQKEEECVALEKPFKEAEESVKAAQEDVRQQEEARESRTKELEAKSEQGGIVSRNKAKQELAQHLSEDPLPLRKAKITLDAANRKAEKARAPFKAAREAAEAARAEADADAAAAAEARAAAEEDEAAATAAAAEAEERMLEAEAKVAEAEAYLEEEKNKSGSAQGSLWWISRELEEKKKYMPRRGK